MFTGIVEEQGTVAALAAVGSGIRITIDATEVLTDAEMGASIAVNGCCLTVVEFSERRWAADAVPETMDRTNLGQLGVGDPVNLERAMRASDRMGGHIVQGHIDGTSTVSSVTAQDDDSWRYRFQLGPELAPYVVAKGSIAVDGISLTVADLGPDWFEIAIIPHTASVTNIGARAVGDLVNIEVDVLGKYVERQLAVRADINQELINQELNDMTGAQA